MNLAEIREIAVTIGTIIGVFFTALYMWKTRVIGADKELIAKYKSDAEKEYKRAEDYKQRWLEDEEEIEKKNKINESLKLRLTKAEATIATYEGQPYRRNNQSLEGLEVNFDPSRPVSEGSL